MKTVVVVGAGAAGLTAAWSLMRAGGFNVVVLERDAVVGGLSRSVEKNGNRMDIGTHQFFQQEREVFDIFTSILPPADPQSADDVMIDRPRIARLKFGNKFFDYPISLKFSTIRRLGVFRAGICAMSLGKSMIFRRRETNLENFYINRFGKKLYKIFFKDYTTKVWGLPPRDLSPRLGTERVAVFSIASAIRNGFKKRKRRIYYPKYGSGQVFEKMAEQIVNMGGKIIKNAPVTAVRVAGGGEGCSNCASRGVSEPPTKSVLKSRSAVSTERGDFEQPSPPPATCVTGVTYKTGGKSVTIDCDYVISSMPLCDLVRALGCTDGEVVRIANGLPFRDFITVGLLLDKSAVKKINGDSFTYVQDRDIRAGRLQIYNNWSPAAVRDDDKYLLALEYYCAVGDEMWNKTDTELQNFAAGELTKIGILDAGAVVHDNIVIRAERAYPAYYGTWNELDKVKEYLLKIDGLFSIGRNGQHAYFNMDKAARTGIEAVRCIPPPPLESVHPCKGGLANTTKTDKRSVWEIKVTPDVS